MYPAPTHARPPTVTSPTRGASSGMVAGPTLMPHVHPESVTYIGFSVGVMQSMSSDTFIHHCGVTQKGFTAPVCFLWSSARPLGGEGEADSLPRRPPPRPAPALSPAPEGEGLPPTHSLFCSAGLHAAARGLLGAAALHVLPDAAERAHLPAEEQAPHGGVRLQRLLQQRRRPAGPGATACSAPQAAAAGKRAPPRSPSVLPTGTRASHPDRSPGTRSLLEAGSTVCSSGPGPWAGVDAPYPAWVPSLPPDMLTCSLLPALPSPHLGEMPFFSRAAPCSWDWLVLRMFAFSADSLLCFFLSSLAPI